MGVRGGGRRKREGDLSKVYPVAPPPHLPLRVGAWALMRDPVELLGRPLKERRDVGTGQAGRADRRGKTCLCAGLLSLLPQQLLECKAPLEGRRSHCEEDACESYLF